MHMMFPPFHPRAGLMAMISTALTAMGLVHAPTRAAKVHPVAARGYTVAARTPAARTPAPRTPAARTPAVPSIAAKMDPIKLTLSPQDQERDYKSDMEIIAQQRNELRRGLHYEKLFHGDYSRKWIALTFDDGPHQEKTPRLLDILRELKVPATFFVVGEEAQLHPELIRQEVADGNEVSNHTYHHARLNHVNPDLIGPEIEACDAVLSDLIGRPADIYLRPPGGEYDRDVVAACKKLGKTIVLYTDDPADYANPTKDVLLARLLKRAGPGGIVLLHDGMDVTMDILPQFVNTMRQRGYRFVTISQMDAATRPPAIRKFQREAPLPKANISLVRRARNRKAPVILQRS